MLALILLIVCINSVLCFNNLFSELKSFIVKRLPIDVNNNIVLSPKIELATTETEQIIIQNNKIYDIIDSYRLKSFNDPSKKDIKLGVLLLNLGGPESMKDVEGFLYNLFADPDIIRLPSFLSLLQKPIAYVIAKRRAPKSSEAYESIGGGSPIVKYTSAQASQIENKLIGKGFNAKCYFAMRYWNPYTEEALKQMADDNINTLVIVPLYPQYSISTSGSSLKLLQELFYKNPEIWGPDKVSHTVVPAWYYRPGYIKTMAKLILNEVTKYNDDEFKEGLHILFSAHGVPRSYIEAGDPYQRQIEECVQFISKEIAAQLADDATRPSSISHEKAQYLIGKFGSKDNNIKPIKVHLSYQSRVGPVEWLKPYTENILQDLGKDGVKNLIVVPVSFVSEHIETLEEIDMEYRELALESGVKHWRRVPALNTDENFIDDMAQLVVEALESPVLSLTEASMQEIDTLQNKMPFFSLTKQSNNNNNNKFLMAGIVGSSLIDLFGGHPIISIVGMR